MKWTKLSDRKPPKDKPILLACPHFCESGYVVAEFNGAEYEVEGYGTLNANEEIQAWSLIKPWYKSIFK